MANQPSMSEAQLSQIGTRIYFYSTAVLTPIGIIGNLITVLVYTSKKLKSGKKSNSTIHFYYCAKAIIDTLLLCTLFPQLLQNSFIQSSLTDFLCKFYYVLMGAFRNISSFLNIIASLDRLRVVVYSTKLVFMERVWFRWVYLVIITLVFGGMYIPYGLNIVLLYSFFCSILSIQEYNNFNWAILVLYAIIPSIFIIVSTVIILIKVKRSASKINKNNETSDKKTSTLRNIIGMNLLFFITTFISATTNTLYSIIITYYPLTAVQIYGKVFIAGSIGKSIALINDSLQVFVHYFTNKSFKDACNEYVEKYILCGCKKPVEKK